MIEMPLGASGMSTVERSTRCAPESCHSIVARASPGHGGPSGGLASRIHSPRSGSSRLSASSAVGWSIALRSFLPPEIERGRSLHCDHDVTYLRLKRTSENAPSRDCLENSQVETCGAYLVARNGRPKRFHDLLQRVALQLARMVRRTHEGVLGHPRLRE